jgi:hypothetical protein
MEQFTERGFLKELYTVMGVARVKFNHDEPEREDDEDEGATDEDTTDDDEEEADDDEEEAGNDADVDAVLAAVDEDDQCKSHFSFLSSPAPHTHTHNIYISLMHTHSHTHHIYPSFPHCYPLLLVLVMVNQIDTAQRTQVYSAFKVASNSPLQLTPAEATMIYAREWQIATRAATAAFVQEIMRCLLLYAPSLTASTLESAPQAVRAEAARRPSGCASLQHIMAQSVTKCV